MEIQVARLRDTLTLLEPAVPRKPTLPVLTHIRLGDGRAVATDLEVAVMADLPEAVDPILLPVKPVMEFLSYTPGHQEARITADKGEIAIDVDSAEARFKAPAPEEFPPIPQLQPQNEGVLDGDALVRALGAVLPYTATKDSRPVLNGVCLTPGDNVEVVGADGYRLAWETVPGRLAGDKPMVIPAGAVSLLMNLWKKAAAPDLANFSNPAQVAMAKRLIRLQWNDDTLQLRFGRVTMLVKLIVGTYPEYHQLIPTKTVASVTVQAEDILRVLQQLRGIAEGSKGIVRLSWEGEKLLVSAQDEDVGEMAVPVAAQSSGPGRIAFNIGILMDYFGPRQGEVTISLTAGGKSGPGVFSHRGVPKAVLMPMFVNDWEPAQTAPEGAAAGQGVGEGSEDEAPVDEADWTDEGHDQGPDEVIADLSDEPPVTSPEAKTPRKRRRKASKS